jgi:hypothetical protein
MRAGSSLAPSGEKGAISKALNCTRNNWPTEDEKAGLEGCGL